MSVFPRVIPVLLVSEGYLVKPVKFSGERYIGDPINAVRIFNEKQVDELVVLDIDAAVKGTDPDHRLIEEIASEAFMPVAYGGGVRTSEQARRITGIGIEKIVLNTAAFETPALVTEIAELLGSSSTVVSIDAKRRITGGYETYSRRASRKTGLSPVDAAKRAVELGAGELIVSSIDRESTFSGYDLKLVASVAEAVEVPVIALGGASGLNDFAAALQAGASAVAAGSLFVLNGKHRAVLITYPGQAEIRSLRPS
ncbi:AglZ/HisF2 family acetamidino modification protein [Ruicaihuangia caeni]|uniref:imidazole glycerol-phosphate synthase n=1 Tax=Ruicaihuangia caeni TaxID=3042517 RepID=A0AAW6T6K2_9MICO|nr:AglZ/HisF2 family acetamidino modification protein [Klugiella sp. YN-L-19]MDI2099412.1 AglZ/HisF2 family acetamidino modification protein [Klugiella sp. YN-L-19]